MSNKIVCFLVPGIMQLLSNLLKPELNLELNLELHGIQCKLFKFTRLNIRIYIFIPKTIRSFELILVILPNLH